jgi:hypothetical protein
MMIERIPGQLIIDMQNKGAERLRERAIEGKSRGTENAL